MAASASAFPPSYCCMLYERPRSYAWLAEAMDLYEPATIHDARSPWVMAPCMAHAPPAACVPTETNATLRPPLVLSSCPGVSKDSVVSRLIWPDSARSLNSAAGPTVTARPNHSAARPSKGVRTIQIASRMAASLSTLRGRWRSRHAVATPSSPSVSFALLEESVEVSVAGASTGAGEDAATAAIGDVLNSPKPASCVTTGTGLATGVTEFARVS